MGLGPPSCDECNVWLRLINGKWICPVCDSHVVLNGYLHLYNNKPVLDDSNIELLRFMLGKGPKKPNP